MLFLLFQTLVRVYNIFMINDVEKKTNRLIRGLDIAVGLFICAVCMIFVLNVGEPVRYLTSPFVYLFGPVYIGLVAYVYFYGLFLMISSKKIKIDCFSRLLGSLILIVGLCSFFSAFHIKEMSKTYNEIFETLKYFKSEVAFNLFINDIGGGFIGYSFVNVFYGLGGYLLVWVFTISVLLIGTFIFFFKEIQKLYRKPKSDSKTKKESISSVEQERQIQKSERRVKEITKPSKKERPAVIKIDNYDVIKDASRIDEPSETSHMTNDSPVAENIGYEPTGDSPYITPFQKAYFILGERPASVHSIPTVSPTVIQEKPIIVDEPNQVFKTVTPSAPSVIKEEPVEEKSEEKAEDDVLEIAPSLIEEPVEVQKPLKTLEPVKQFKTTPDEPALSSEPVIKKQTVWVAPSDKLLSTIDNKESEQANIEIAESRMALLNEIFDNFSIGARAVSYIIGPAVTMFNIEFDPNVSAKSLNNLVDDLSRRLGGVPTRFESVVEGSYYSGLEVPNAKINSVSFKEVFTKLPDATKHPLAIAFGKNVKGEVIYADFDEFPHALVAGTTGSGKSIFIHSIITTLIMRNSPENLKIALIDPKVVEMMQYRDIPHLLCPIISEGSKGKIFLEKLVDEMNRRYALFAELEGCTSLKEYNEIAQEKGLEKLPSIIVFIDEYGDLVETTKGFDTPVLLLGNKARASGIHMLVSTQSPTTNVISGTIKNNLKTHIALTTANVTQSQTILGVGGAEKLLGKGDMLVQSPLVSRVGLVRLQGCFINKREISYVTGYLKNNYGPQYDEKYLNLEEVAEVEAKEFIANGGAIVGENNEEAKYQSIKEWVMTHEYMSMSKIQRECGVGFNRAGRFFKRLQEEGIVDTVSDGAKGCRVLTDDEFEYNGIVTSKELTR